MIQSCNILDLVNLLRDAFSMTQLLRTVDADPQVAAMRRFNRFYTRQIGLLDEGLLSSSFSLTQVRTLYELAQGERATAVELCKTLGLDAGYLSRILAGFEKSGLIEKEESPEDARQTLLRLTKKG